MLGKLKAFWPGLVGGAVGAIAVAALIFMAQAIWSGADSGDWLNFAAVVFGVAATILGTRTIDRLVALRRHRRAARVLAITLEVWKDGIERTRTEPTKLRFDDLRRELAFVLAQGGGIDPEAIGVQRALHAFEFHAPIWIKEAERLAKGPQAPGIQRGMERRLDDLRSLAENVSEALATI